MDYLVLSWIIALDCLWLSQIISEHILECFLYKFEITHTLFFWCAGEVLYSPLLEASRNVSCKCFGLNYIAFLQSEYLALFFGWNWMKSWYFCLITEKILGNVLDEIALQFLSLNAAGVVKLHSCALYMTARQKIGWGPGKKRTKLKLFKLCNFKIWVLVLNLYVHWKDYLRRSQSCSIWDKSFAEYPAGK